MRHTAGMTRSALHWLAVAVTALALTRAAAARQPPTFSTGVELVTVGVSVTNLTRERYIDGLTAADFRVFENGEPVPVALLTHERRPVSVCLVLDASGSMGFDLKRELARSSADALVRQLDPGDEVAALVFRKDVDVRQPWTLVRDLGAIAWGDSSDGGTAVFDGLRSALQLLDGARHPRRVIVLLTDGIENSSRLSLASLSTTRRQSEAVIYALDIAAAGLAPPRLPPAPSAPDLEMPVVPEVHLVDPRKSSDLVLPQQPRPVLPHLVPAAAGPAPVGGTGTDVLESLVSEAGGTLMRVTSGAEAAQAARTIVADLRQEYTLAYTPPRALDGAYRRLRVESTRPGLFVRHRLGYLATPGARTRETPAPPAAAAASPAAISGPRGPYTAAVRLFQASGTFAAVEGVIGAWSREELSAAVAATARTADPELARAAALFHLEVALDGAPRSADNALYHLDLGTRLLAPIVGRDTATREFAAHWHAVAMSIFLAQSDTGRARDQRRRAMSQVPDAALTLFLTGRIEDVEALRFDADVALDAPSTRSITNERMMRLAIAERAYRQAAKVDPAHRSTAVHLGRVSSLLGKHDEARRLLEPVAAATDAVAADRYLASLFLAEEYERAGETARARGLLEAIDGFAPGRQTAWIALAALEQRAGRVDRARALADAADGTDRDEWWAYRNGGRQTEDLAWLRERLSR